MDDQAKYAAARRQVRRLRGFYWHLAVYVPVNLLLVLINLVTYPKTHSVWFYWPLLGWGLGLTAHAATVFGSGFPWGRDWEERKIKELMEKDRT